MCPELGLIATIGVFIGAVCVAIVFLKSGVQDVIEAWKYRDKVGFFKGGGKIVIVPVVFVGIIILGLLLIELMYIC